MSKSGPSGPFVSYAREDSGLARALVSALGRRDIHPWLDARDIRPSSEWRQEIRAAIRAAPSVIFLVSPDSAKSEICSWELEEAVRGGKRIIPVLARPVDPSQVQEAVRRRHWIAMVGDQELKTGLEPLVTALSTSPEWAAAHARLLVRATEWEEAEDPSFLLRGHDLEAAEGWLGDAARDTAPVPTKLQQRFLIASRTAQTRSMRLRMSLLTVGLVVALVLAGFAFAQREEARQQARDARSRELAARSLSTAPENPEAALLIALRAADTSDTPEAEQAVRQTIDDFHGVRAFAQGSASIRAVAIAPSSRLLVAGSDDGLVRAWNLDTGKLRARLRAGPKKVVATVIPSGGRTLYTATQDGTVRVWQLPSGKLVRDLPHQRSPLNSMAVSGNGRIMIVAGEGAAILHMKGKAEPIRLRTRGLINGVDLDYRGSLALTAANSGAGTVWATKSGEPIHRLTTPHHTLFGADLTPDGQYAALAGDDGVARVWALTDHPRPVSRLPIGLDVVIYGVKFDSRADRLVTTSIDGAARIWKLKLSGNRPSPAVLAVNLKAPAGRLYGAAFATGGRVVTGGSDGVARLWNLKSINPVRTLSKLSSNDDQALGGIAFTRDGHRVAIGRFGGLQVTDLNGRRVRWLSGGNFNYGAALSPSGHLAAAVSDVGTLRVWDIASKNNLFQRSVAPPEPEYYVSFSPDGRLVVISKLASGTVSVLAQKFGRLVHRFRGDPKGVQEAGFTGDGRRLVTLGASGRVRTWDVGTWRRINQFSVVVEVPFGFSLSPDDSKIAVIGVGQSTFSIWSLTDGTRLQTFRGHTGGVTAVAFDPTGRYLATGGVDRAIRIWSVDSGQRVSLTPVAAGKISGLAFSPRSGGLFATSFNGTTYSVRCRTCLALDRLRELGERRINSALTPKETAAYLSELED